MSMGDGVPEAGELTLVTLDDIDQARHRLHRSGMVVRTPVLREVQALFPEVGDIRLHVKLESMQNTGSFKIRGVVNQLDQVLEENKSHRTLVTMSAGNYGKAFAYYLQKTRLPAICVMPNTVPDNRVALIKSMGVRVEQCPSAELQSTVDQLVKDKGCLQCHSFDDLRLIAGYGTLCLEVVEEEGLQPDVVVVCCGGGGLVSGLAAAFHLTAKKPVRVYAVEPEGANTMWESFRAGHAVSKQPSSVAAGLSPPYAGKLCYAHCRRYVEDVVLVSDHEILDAMRKLLDRGIKAEPSGCAAMAAILNGRVPEVEGREVLVVITGSNVTVGELAGLLSTPS